MSAWITGAAWMGWPLMLMVTWRNGRRRWNCASITHRPGRIRQRQGVDDLHVALT